MAPTKNKQRRFLDSGIFWMIVAALLFSAMSACAKTAMMHAHSTQAVLIRSAVGFLIVLSLCQIRSIPLLGSRSPLLLLRGFFGFLGLFFFFYSLSKIPMGNAHILNNTAPIFVVLLSASVLTERVHRGTYLLLPLFLLGIGLVVRFEYSFELVPSLAGLLSGFFSALAYLCLSKLGSTDHASTVVLYFTGISTIGALPLALAHWTPLDGQSVGLLVASGMISTAAQLCMTHAYRLEKASVVSLFQYMGPVFAYLWGLFLFSEAPSARALVGAALLIACGWMVSRLAELKISFLR